MIFGGGQGLDAAAVVAVCAAVLLADDESGDVALAGLPAASEPVVAGATPQFGEIFLLCRRRLAIRGWAAGAFGGVATGAEGFASAGGGWAGVSC
jgi:hypothetical protein